MADPGFSPGDAPTPKIAIIFQIFAENCIPGAPLGSANAMHLSLGQFILFYLAQKQDVTLFNIPFQILQCRVTTVFLDSTDF